MSHGESVAFHDVLNVVVAIINFSTDRINNLVCGRAIARKTSTALNALESTLLTILNSASFMITASSTLTAIGVLLFKDNVGPSDYINLCLSLYYFHGAYMKPKTAEGVYNHFREEYNKNLQIEAEHNQKKEEIETLTKKIDELEDSKEPVLQEELEKSRKRLDELSSSIEVKTLFYKDFKQRRQNKLRKCL